MTYGYVRVEEFRLQSREWLASVARALPSGAEVGTVLEWGFGSDDVSVFHDLSAEAERDVIVRAAEWQRQKFEAGYGAIAWPREVGGSDLSPAHEQVFREEEGRFDVPGTHELNRISVNLVAPTIWAMGSLELKHRLVGPFLRGEQFTCQLFSEPNAGSDLANVSTSAVRDGDSWIVNGSKVWVSGARFAQWGELISRTDPTVAKHAGLTAFMVPLDAEGVDVRPIRQMSGGTSFNEVFMTDVRISDELRLGDIGAGWSVALATLAFERAQSGAKLGVGGSFERLLAVARHTGKAVDPVVRQRLAALYTHERARELTRLRAEAARRAGDAPGAEGSIGKLLWVAGMGQMSVIASNLLGPALVADTGEWGTYAWASHVLGAPGFRIAGGSDEIQRNILGERALGLPGEPRPDTAPQERR